MLRRSSIALLIFLAAPALPAQELPKPSWRKEFQEVEVKTIKPQDLPGPEESKFPTSLQSRNVLPAPASLDALRETAAELSDRVVEVVAVVRPNIGTVAPPIYVRGHAVWLSAAPDAANPVLVSPYHWLRDAEKIVVLPAKKRQKGQASLTERRTIQHPEGDLAKLVKSGDAIPVALQRADEHRNLAILSAPPDDLPVPTAGLAFFPYEGQSPTRAYGYSPQLGHALVETQFLETPPKEAELVFYLQSTYPAILGAPIVADDGRVLALTAMRHPNDQDRTLVIPPGALTRFVKKAQGLDDKPE